MASDLVSAFQEFRTIFGICPCCGEVFRLSDVSLYVKGKRPRTIFDELTERGNALDRAEARPDEKEGGLREQAREKGRRLAKRSLRRIDPVFSGRGIDPQDVKVIFDPIEYVVFDGMNVDRLRGVMLMDRAPNTATRERIHKSVQGAIRKGNYGWATLRITANGQVQND